MVINLAYSSLEISDIAKTVTQYPISGLKELFIMKGDAIFIVGEE